MEDTELWVLMQHLAVPEQARTLDVGGTDNALSKWLEDAGCEAWVVDLRPYGYPLKKFIQGNFLTVPIPENYFDLAFDISAIHHFSVEHYTPIETPTDDIRAVRKVYDSLKSGGVFYACMDRFKTQYAATDFFHQYNHESFRTRYVQNFQVEEMRYYSAAGVEVPYGDEWMEIVYAKLKKP